MRYGWSIDVASYEGIMAEWPWGESLGRDWKRIPLDFGMLQNNADHINRDAMGVYMVSARFSKSLRQPVAADPYLDVIIYVGRGELRKRYIQHQRGESGPRLKSALQCFTSVGASVYFHYTIERDPSRRSSLEVAMINLIGPPGNAIAGSRVRLRGEVPA